MIVNTFFIYSLFFPLFYVAGNKGNNQRQGFHPDNEVEHPPFNDGDFIRPSSQEDLSNGQARDPYVGTEVHFDTFQSLI